ncbi:MAG: SpoIIE family protein phosphatase, partial [Bacteroidota bacterium]|nr:SpoIIE family protein phosphatase [Bacteroidota bacterium]
SSLYFDRNGIVWIGSEEVSALTRYIPGKDTFEILNLNNNLIPSSITETNDGTIWLGTQYGVLGLKDDTIAIHFTENDGLLSNNINLLQADNRGVLYIGTNTGLNSLNIETGTINTYTEENGFVGIETKQNASFLDSKGHLWFGTANGATELAPENIPPPDLSPLTHIKGIMVNFEEREMTPGMRLRHTEKNITFNYYSVCLTNPEAVSYQVMIEGADPEWRPETEQTTAIYSSLSPGRYTFKVKAQNSDGIWNEEPVTFDFVIRPPFYASPWFITALIVLAAVAVMVYIRIRERNLVREKRILEEKVEERTAEVVQKSMVIEEKNRDITASIRYAERIQMAMLPTEDSFDDTFVLFLPKDIVSGDFYWMHDNGDVQFIAAVDCTGHGVPGAFMSIIGHNSLTKIVREYGITRPAAILDQLNVEITRSLIQRGDEVISDGMDLALIAYDKKHKKLEYAGAYNPLVIIRDGELITIKGNRFPIGMAAAREKKFTNVEVDIESGDNLYMFSDGYADQFGGSENKKFKVVNLKKELLRISHLPMNQQKEQLLKTLDEWMGGVSQIDDILIIGTRVP